MYVTEYQGKEDYYNVTVEHPSSKSRSFSGFKYFLTWDYEKKDCLYAGNSQGGPSPELEDLKDSVIEGRYSEYVTDGPFETQFRYSIFKNECD